MRSLLVSLLLISFSIPEGAAQGPNYILIFCDDLGYGDLGCFGY